MNPLFVKPIIDLAGDVFDRLIPDKEQAAKLKNEFAQQAASMDQQALQGFRDFVVAYEGRGDEVHPWLQILRGSVRPILTYALAGLYGWGFLNPDTFTQDTTAGLFQLNLISLGFWYGERAMKNLGLKLGARRASSDG